MTVRGPGYDSVAGMAPKLGAEPGDDAFMWQRAYEDALKSLRSIPDPALFAASIDEHHREALRTAWRGLEGWRVQPTAVRELRILGLVEIGGNYRLDDDPRFESRNHLTAFGVAVRRVVMEAI